MTTPSGAPSPSLTVPVPKRSLGAHFGSVVTNTGCFLLLLLPLTWVLIAIVFGALVGDRVPAPLRWVLTIALAVAICAGLGLLKAMQNRRREAQTTVTADSTGLTFADAGGVRYLPWSGMQRVAQVKVLRGNPMRLRISPLAQATIDAAGAASAQLGAGLGIVGRGQLLSNGPAGQPIQLTGNDANAWGVDATTGEALVGIDLTLVSRRWDTHELGAWVQHYRPDLYAEAVAALAK